MTELDEVIQLVQTTIRIGWPLKFIPQDVAFKLESDVNVALNEDGWSILHMAVHQHDQSHMLMGAGPHFKLFENPIAKLKENIFKLIELLIRCNANVNLPDKYGRPPIFFAASEEISDLLIKNGAVVFFQDLKFSALHVQCFLWKRYFGPFLQDDLSALKQDAQGKLPLHLALSCQKVTLDEVIILIKCAPGSIEIYDNEKIYPLGYAALYASDEIFSFILENSSMHVLEMTYDQINNDIIRLDDDIPEENGTSKWLDGISTLSSMLDEKNQIVPVGDTREEEQNVLSSSDKLVVPFNHTIDEGDFTCKEYLVPSEYLPLLGGGKSKNKKANTLSQIEAQSHLRVNREKYSKIAESMLIRSNLEKTVAKKEMESFDKKINFADLTTLQKDFKKFLRKIAVEEDLMGLRTENNYRISDGNYFRLDIVNRVGTNPAWVVQLQDNTGKRNKAGTKSLSSVFAIVCIPKSYTTINGGELSRLLQESYDNSGPVEIASINSLRPMRR